ncbi:Fungal specific transcription factor domain protein [Pleurostoma richardsiae]|uniref:Fungal specific transcription factor domain protein n=1 Tax=Pleurostoma richardsiae TaxID=41990 RepID=A0AA38R172_9PEZI|nr:Fungal specific transcription factor domain protein [Pleurostoma richardsiae]
MRMHSHPANYVGSVHWAAVLDSISELRDHYEEEEEARILATSDCVPRNSPRLLYEPVQATKADILALIPARPVVDRIVARYFNAQSTTPLSMLHSVHFLREYERFWQEPSSASVLWIGLLFSIMALTLQFSQLGEDETDPEDVVRIYVFREQTIHCLGLGHYTKGGEYVLETMINYIALEMSLCKDADIGLWLVLGMLIQLALSMGYHRDAQNFSNISPFAGEMRRRVWAVIVQMDLRLSSQMGFPRLLKLHQCDTAEPRNLLDTDFDETCTELPPSRPETEVTPVLYILAKNRVDGMTGWVSDLLAEVREHPYAEIMELDRKLEDAENSLPPVFRWQPLSQSLMVPPQIIIYRIWLHLSIPRLKIWLHRKYLAPSYAQSEYAYSRNACVQAAMKILEFQQLVDEETQPDGLLYSARWMMITSLQQFVFLLGTSILCYYVQLAKTRPDVSMDQKTSARIYELLRNTYPIWLRSSTVSQEARRAAVHLSLLLGLRGQETEGPLAEEAAAVATAATSDYTTPQNAGMSFDQVTWDAYQECIANFPPTAAFGADFFAPPVPGSSSEAGVSMADPMVGNTVELGGWMEGHGA